MTVRTLKGGSTVAYGDQSVKRPAYADGLMLLDPTGKMEGIAKPGVDGVSVPMCAVCPPPSYTDEARKAKIQGNVILTVVIDAQGRPSRIVATNYNDASLAAKAVEAVKKWKFEPAKDKNGKAVAVIIPIEVTFRLF